MQDQIVARGNANSPTKLVQVVKRDSSRSRHGRFAVYGKNVRGRIGNRVARQAQIVANGQRANTHCATSGYGQIAQRRSRYSEG